MAPPFVTFLLNTLHARPSAHPRHLSSKKTRADQALQAWLQKANPGFNNTARLPILALTPGVFQGYVVRDSNVGTSGLYQPSPIRTGSAQLI